MLKKFLIATAGLLVAVPAFAGHHHHDRGNHYGHWKHDRHHRVAPRVVVVPQPVIVAPAPVYYSRPAPVYYYAPPAPVYYPAAPAGVSIRFNLPL